MLGEEEPGQQAVDPQQPVAGQRDPTGVGRHQIAIVTERRQRAREALEIATRGGADILGRPECGRIEVGARADIAIWDVSGIESAGSWDPAALLLAGPTTVRDLLVEGRSVVRDGQVVTIDLPAQIAQQNKLARALRDAI